MKLARLALPLALIGAAWAAGCGSSSPQVVGNCTSDNSALVMWESPMGSDGVTVDQTIQGFYVYVGTISRTYPQKIRLDITAPVVESYYQVVTGLAAGTHYFTVTAFNASGESAYGNEASWHFAACGAQTSIALGSH